MNQLNILTLLFVALLGLVSARDSAGKDFVFSFAIDNSLSYAAQTSVFIVPTSKDSNCTIKYTDEYSLITKQATAKYGQLNEVTLDENSVSTPIDYISYGFNDNAHTDFRIFVKCNQEVTLYGRLNEPLNNFGDMFLIPASTNAGTKYVIPIPAQYSNKRGSLLVLPVAQTGLVTVSVEGYINGVLKSNKTNTYDVTLVQSQHYTSILILHTTDNATVIITSSTPVMVSFTTSFATTSNSGTDGSCGQSCNRDYITFMPLPEHPKTCSNGALFHDHRMITSDLTTSLYIAPPTVPPTCDEVFSLSVFGINDNSKGVSKIIPRTGTSSITLTDKPEVATNSKHGVMPMYRLGSILTKPDSLTAFGHIAHIVPSTAEWVSGKTQFFALGKDCVIEFYKVGFATDSIRLDKAPLVKGSFTSNVLSYFGNKYAHGIVPITSYGLHTFETSGHYVLYVVCKNVNGPYNALGYLTGFNKRS
uniref:IgGFc_binding domain-containing protein n=1 Tax=Rhabditophanes sp. KR3021 TaxID=114890 RepID=A0AC35U9I9_9BILA